MERSNKRGKIPQSDWPLIMARYEAGETLASIARTYDCSPPAISYVVSKSRARQPSPGRSAAGPSGAEAQLIKSVTGGSAGSRPAGRLRADAPPARGNPLPASTERRPDALPTGPETTAAPAVPPPANGRSPQNRDADRVARDGFPDRGPTPAQAPGGADNGQRAPVGTGARAASPLSRSGGDTRHRLHLSLGNGPLGTGPSPYDGSGETLFPPSGRSVADESQFVQGPGAAHTARPPAAAANRPPATEFSEAGPGPNPMLRQNAGEAGAGAATRNREGTSAFIDQDLRARVDTDIAAFLTAFDAALTQDTQESRAALREATDRLLRAGARTRIELERLEARVPLTAHDRDGSAPGPWRQR